jgi:hypothetical protein
MQEYSDLKHERPTSGRVVRWHELVAKTVEHLAPRAGAE